MSYPGHLWKIKSVYSKPDRQGYPIFIFCVYQCRTFRNIVVHWPTTQPGCQNKKCTCVNNRCIRSRNIRIYPWPWTDWMSAIFDAHKKKVDIELSYYSVHRKFNRLETRCGRESQHPAEGTLWPPINQLRIRLVGDKILDWGSYSREAVSPGPGWAAQENGKETLLAIRVGVNMLQFCSVANSLSHTTLSNKVRGIFFLKDCVDRLYYCVVVFCMQMYMFV